MWKNKVNGLLGIWLIILAFLDFSDTVHRFLLVFTAACIILVAFYGNFLIKPTREFRKYIAKEEEKAQDGTAEPPLNGKNPNAAKPENPA